MRNKTVKRLAFFIIFLMPVLWYFFLQFFGSNNFSLTSIETISPACKIYPEITVVSKNDLLSVIETNYINRVIDAVGQRKTPLVYASSEFFNCIRQSASDLILINKKEIFGTYELSRDGVDKLLVELDILLLQQTNGKETS